MVYGVMRYNTPVLRVDSVTDYPLRYIDFDSLGARKRKPKNNMEPMIFTRYKKIHAAVSYVLAVIKAIGSVGASAHGRYKRRSKEGSSDIAPDQG